ncbi:MAG: DoxX family protein [Chlamydiales bacterium]|nr:DoxX family protein [Chlamydiales bacterium]
MASEFFILSGFFKLFDSDQHAKLFKDDDFGQHSVSEFNAYFVPLVELLGGALILIGLHLSLSALVLLIIMVTAIVTERIAEVAMHGRLILIENFFYLPEVLYTLIFFWLFFSGPGKISFDYVIGKKKRMSRY